MITKNLGLNFTTWDSVITFYFGRRVGSPKIVLIKLLERKHINSCIHYGVRTVITVIVVIVKTYNSHCLFIFY